MHTGFSLPGDRGNTIGADLGSVRENAHRKVSHTPAALRHSNGWRMAAHPRPVCES